MRGQLNASASPLRRAALTLASSALALAAWAPSALAQDAAAKEGSGDVLVRERRASKEGAKAEAAASAETPADDEAGLEELRARAGAEKNAQERGRLQRALVERLTAAGRKAEAVSLLRGMLAEDRFDPPFFYNTGNALARLGESEAAVEAYRKAVAQRRGNYARAQHNLGVVLARLGRWEESEAALTAALKLENYTYAEASYSLGRLHALRGEAGQAIAEWERTLRLDPSHSAAAVARARALAEDGDPEAALEVLGAFASRASRSGGGVPREVAVARGEILAAAHVADSARESAKDGGAAAEAKAIRANADGRDPLTLIREARPGSLRPLTVDRETYELLKRARAARAKERDDEAAALYGRAIESGGGYFLPANVELSYTLAALKRREEAVEGLLTVVRREGGRYPIAFYHLGRYYELLGKFEESAESFARAAQLLGGESPQFYIDLSRVREKEGKLAEALAAAEAYVRAMERNGAAPEWAHGLVSRLREKVRN
ncbi:MAG TPA: tetratricopeptide repeat protein [Pyrinomonadaceae bacterium]|nr:tetratricopeptide repeat protein [Pyrinomonadaceae bacterium]